MRLLGSFTAGLLMVGATGCGAGLEDPTYPRQTLDHSLAMYGVGNASDAAEAQSDGASIVVLPYATASRGYIDALDKLGIGILDSSVKNLVYRAQCPDGHGSCRNLTEGEIAQLSERVSEHLDETRRSPAVSGYYILDDNYTDMTAALGAVAQVIHAADPNRPTVCPFNLPLVPFGADPSAALGVFKKTLRNYSPEWCDRVAIYAYVQPRSITTAELIDWDMRSVLPAALGALRERGWDSATSPLIGVPQAFGYSERGLRTGTHRPAPAKDELRSQIRAFCRAGANAILAYVWNSRARERDVLELHNSPDLRAGMRQGIADCETGFWS